MSETKQPVRLLRGDLFSDLVGRAGEAPRRRVNYNFHDGPEEICHRFLNVMMRDTYITPHRHLDPPKHESFVLLEGRGAFFTFDDAGEVKSCDLLDAGAPRNVPPGGADAPAPAACVGVDVIPGIWHCLVVLSAHAICFEVKPGPYKPMDDKEFAAWAPREGDAGAAEYRDRLRAEAERRFGLSRV